MVVGKANACLCQHQIAKVMPRRRRFIKWDRLSSLLILKPTPASYVLDLETTMHSAVCVCAGLRYLNISHGGFDDVKKHVKELCQSVDFKSEIYTAVLCNKTLEQSHMRLVTV